MKEFTELLEKRYKDQFFNAFKTDFLSYRNLITQKRHQNTPGGSMQLVAENGKYRISTVHYQINETNISETGVFELGGDEPNWGEPGIVESYKTREEAVFGHFKWCDKYDVPRGNTKVGER